MRHYVTYTRVSTAEQGKSGLGLDAQETDIAIYLDRHRDEPYEVLGTFRDVLSGKIANRPELEKALALVRKTGAELLVAKLDRLGRSVSHIAALMDDPKVKLRVAQMPNADKFQLHIYAALAEQERNFISARTKAALAAAKRRGKKLGGMRDKTMARNAAVKEKAHAEAEQAMRVIGPMRAADMTLSAIASNLNSMRVPTSRGGAWTATQVARTLARVAAEA